jgi:peroxiredoxin
MISNIRISYLTPKQPYFSKGEVPGVRLLLFFTFLLFNLSLFASNVIIQGNSPEYAGQAVTFYIYENPIINKEKAVTTFKVQDNGDFKTEFSVSKTEYIFSHAGIFFLFLYAEPGMDYTIKLPARTEKKPEDKLNPYFEELKVHLLILSAKSVTQGGNIDTKNELNFFIRTFDSYFDPYYDKYAMNIYTKADVSEMDTTLKKIESTFANNTLPYFKEYYDYRMGLLKFMSTRFKSRNISNNYFLHKPVLYCNPAYIELFDQIYDKYFVYFGRTPAGKVIYDDINSFKSLSRLKATLALDKVLDNDTLKELVMLKGIYDGFYEMEFSRSSLLQILDSIIYNSSIPKHQAFAKDIREKVTRLLVGFSPPDFKLLNQDSVLMSLKDFKNSYVYLIFCTTQNYACLKEFELLKKIQEKFGNRIKIVIISADESWSDIRNFLSKYKYTLTFLHYGNQPDILKEYDIRAFPTCYLIDREGKLGMSPAVSPSENFEIHLFKYLKAKGEL